VAVRAGEEAWSADERRGAQRAMGTSERQWASVYDNGMDERTVAAGLSRLGGGTKPPETPSPLKRGRVAMEGAAVARPAVVVRPLGHQFAAAAPAPLAAAAPARVAAAAPAPLAAAAPARVAAAAPARVAAAAPPAFAAAAPPAFAAAAPPAFAAVGDAAGKLMEVRREHCVSAEVAGSMSMAKLCAQWTLIYGRRCQTQNKVYLIKSVTYPGLSRLRRPKSPPVRPVQHVHEAVYVPTEDPLWAAGSDETSEDEVDAGGALHWDDVEAGDGYGRTPASRRVPAWPR